MIFNKVLLTTDLSENSFRAFDPAQDIVKESGAQLEVIYIVEDWNVPPEISKMTSNVVLVPLHESMTAPESTGGSANKTVTSAVSEQSPIASIH